MSSANDNNDVGVQINDAIARKVVALNAARDRMARLEDELAELVGELAELVDEKKDMQEECEHCNDCSVCLG